MRLGFSRFRSQIPENKPDVFWRFWLEIWTMRIITFARVSSCEQEREGYSLEAQEKAMREKVAREGWEIIKEFRVAESAKKSENRTEFRKMLKYVRENRNIDVSSSTRPTAQHEICRM
jgi:hypothetical protein